MIKNNPEYCLAAKFGGLEIYRHRDNPDTMYTFVFFEGESITGVSDIEYESQAKKPEFKSISFLYDGANEKRQRDLVDRLKKEGWVVTLEGISPYITLEGIISDLEQEVASKIVNFRSKGY